VFISVNGITSTGEQYHHSVHIVIPASINTAVFSELSKLLGLRIFDDVCLNNFLLKLSSASTPGDEIKFVCFHISFQTIRGLLTDQMWM